MGQTPTQAVRGYQLRVDGSGITCHPGDLKAFLDEIVPAIGMTLVAGPFVSEPHGQGIVIIAESHVWLEVQGSKGICIVFSCRPFERSVVLSRLRRIFGGKWRTRWSIGRSEEGEMMPYILNKTWLGLRIVVHRRGELTERCNTDDIKHRGEADWLDPRWHKCRWCWPSERAELPREALR